MLIYNILEYSSNYSDRTGSSWFYSKDKANNSNTNTANTNDFKCFKYKIKLIGKIQFCKNKKQLQIQF